MNRLSLSWVFLFFTNIYLSASECSINPFEVDLHPLIIISNTSNFIYPKLGQQNLKFSTGTSIDIMCPGKRIEIGNFQTKTSLMKAICTAGSNFQLENIQIEWKQLKCNNVPWRSIRYTGNNCAQIGKEIEIGFEVEDGRFLRTLLICFDDELQTTFYSFNQLTSAINQRVTKNPRPSWLQGFGFYSIGKVTNLYLRKNQRKIINRLVGLPDRSTKYIKDSANYFLARGHLTARSDNFYAAQQDATFFMQNVAPQWQTFNGLNWNQIEIDVRDYAELGGTDLDIYTGVYGIATLPHEETGEDTQLYLYVNDGYQALPVPELFWKVVYNPITERGLAIIGVNNPYVGHFKVICDDVSDEIGWLHFKKNDRKLGFCYACSVNQFREVVDVLPEFNTIGLLL